MKNYKILILLILILLGGGIFFRFRQMPTVTQEKDPTDYYELAGKKITLKNIDFGSDSDLKLAKASLITTEVLAQKLGFTSEGQKEIRSLTWTEGSKKLLVNASNTFDFSDDSNLKVENLKDVPEAEKVALDFVQNLGLLGSDLSLKVVKTDLIKEGRNLSRDFAGASFIIINFDTLYAGKTVYFQPEGQTQFQIWLDKAGNVKRFNGPFPTVITNPQSQAIRSKNEILSELKNGQGKIVQILQTETPPSGKGENLSYSEVTFEIGEIVYVFESGRIMPFYQVTGIAQNPDSRDLSILVHLTAVE